MNPLDRNGRGHVDGDEDEARPMDCIRNGVCGVVLSLLLVIAALPARAVDGLLLIGDSWAEQQWTDQAHALAFDVLGYGGVFVPGEGAFPEGGVFHRVVDQAGLEAPLAFGCQGVLHQGSQHALGHPFGGICIGFNRAIQADLHAGLRIGLCGWKRQHGCREHDRFFHDVPFQFQWVGLRRDPSIT